MWRTPGGDRILVGAEADVFKSAVRSLRSGLVDPPCPRDSGIAVFDRLTLGQRLSVLVEVTMALLDERVPSPAHTAANEAAIAAVFEQLVTSIESEIDDAASTTRPTDLRRLVRQACSDRDPGFDAPPLRSDDIDQWLRCIEALRDQILWDADYAAEDCFVDAVPTRAQEIHTFMGVSRDYFTTVPPDPRDGEIGAVLRRLDELCA